RHQGVGGKLVGKLGVGKSGGEALNVIHSRLGIVLVGDRIESHCLQEGVRAFIGGVFGIIPPVLRSGGGWFRFFLVRVVGGASPRRILYNFGIILRGLRNVGLEDEQTQVIRGTDERLVPVIQRLLRVTRGLINLRDLPIAVGFGRRIGRELLHEVLIQSRPLLRVLLGGNGLQ